MTDTIPVVDYWFDPVCPYSWIGSRWLHEVAARRSVEVHWHLMSLYLLNEHRDIDQGYRDYLGSIHGVVRTAAAAVEHAGAGVLGELYTAFGQRVFDHWRYPPPQECRGAMVEALRDVHLPARLIEAFAAPGHAIHDAALHHSHHEALAAVGPDAGTPITRIDGVAFFGPVLNSIPRGDEAIAVFDGARQLAGFHDFFELKRARTTAPTYT